MEGEDEGESDGDEREGLEEEEGVTEEMKEGGLEVELDSSDLIVLDDDVEVRDERKEGRKRREGQQKSASG